MGSAAVQFRDLDFLVDEGYQVGDDGSVWSRRKLKPLGGTGNKGFICVLTDTWKMLKPGGSGRYKHQTVSLRKDGKMRSFYVHRLVLEAFVGPCPKGMECRHLDGNPKNNHLANLCWGTSKENSEDQHHHGTQIRGTRVGGAKLTEDKVRRIRKLYAAGGYTYQSLADEYGVSGSAIHNAVIGRNWYWIPLEK